MIRNAWILVGVAASLKMDMETMANVCKIENTVENLKKYFRAMEQYQALRDLYVDWQLSLIEEEMSAVETVLEQKIREYAERIAA